jgi:hypothetical protein
MNDNQKIPNETCREMTMREKIEAITEEMSKIIREINGLTNEIIYDILDPSKICPNEACCDDEGVNKSSFLPHTLCLLTDQKELLMTIRNKLTDVHKNVCKQ